ncbi:MAG: hypothetical protein JXA72_09575 [Bacteroidales bacterium]|nr:hypothetical protein [Bacteroidales bacterium]
MKKAFTILLVFTLAWSNSIAQNNNEELLSGLIRLINLIAQFKASPVDNNVYIDSLKIKMQNDCHILLLKKISDYRLMHNIWPQSIQNLDIYEDSTFSGCINNLSDIDTFKVSQDSLFYNYPLKTVDNMIIPLTLCIGKDNELNILYIGNYRTETEQMEMDKRKSTEEFTIEW